MSDIQQRIADILNQHTANGSEPDYVSCYCSADYFSSFEEQCAHVAGVLVSELGLYRHLAFVKQCSDGAWRQWHGPADKPNPEGVIPGMRYVTGWEPQFVQDVPDA